MPLLMGTGWALEWLSGEREGSCPWSHIPCTTTPQPRPRGEPQRAVCRVRREGVGTGAPPGEASGDGELQLQWLWVVELVPSLTAAGRRAWAPRAGLAFLRVRLPCRHSRPRRPRAPSLPVWVLCPPPPAPGLLLAWPSLGACHTGSQMHPAPRKTEGRMGPLGGDPSGQKDAGSWRRGRVRVGDAASPQEGGGTAPGPGGGFDLERQFPQSSCLPAPRVWIQACHVQGPLGCMTCAVSPPNYSWPLWNLLSNTSVRCVRSLGP